MTTILSKLTSPKQELTFHTAYVLDCLSASTSNNLQLHAHRKYFPLFLYVLYFQQSTNVRTTEVGCLARRLAPSSTVSYGPQTGAPVPAAVAQVSPPAPPTRTGLVACRLRPDCARSGRAKRCQVSEGCSWSVQFRVKFLSAVWIPFT